MNKELLLALLFALKVEIAFFLLFIFGLRFGLRTIITKKLLVTFYVALTTTTFGTLLAFGYFAFLKG